MPGKDTCQVCLLMLQGLSTLSQTADAIAMIECYVDLQFFYTLTVNIKQQNKMELLTRPDWVQPGGVQCPLHPGQGGQVPTDPTPPRGCPSSPGGSPLPPRPGEDQLGAPVPQDPPAVLNRVLRLRHHRGPGQAVCPGLQVGPRVSRPRDSPHDGRLKHTGLINCQLFTIKNLCKKCVFFHTIKACVSCS